MQDRIERSLIRLHRYFSNELIERKSSLVFKRNVRRTYQHVTVDFFQFEPRKKMDFNINEPHD